MYSPREILNREPAAISAAVLALINVAVLLGAVDLSANQLGGINTAVALLLGLFVRQSVTPNEKL